MSELKTKCCCDPTCSTLWINVPAKGPHYCKNCGMRLIAITDKTANDCIRKNWLYGMNQYDWTTELHNRIYKTNFEPEQNTLF